MDPTDLAKTNWESLCNLVNTGHFRDEQEYESVLNTIFATAYRWQTARQEEFPIGNHNRIRLDISLKDHDGNIRVIIEVKSRELQVGAEELNQINSYLKQTKVKFGLLIGRHISIIYNPPESDPIKLADIPFDTHNQNGLKLSKLLYYPDFDSTKFESLCSEFRNKLEIEENARELRRKLLGPEGTEILKSALAGSSQLLEDYNPESIKIAIENLKISEDKPAVLQPAPTKSQPRMPQIHRVSQQAPSGTTSIIDILNSPSSTLTGRRIKSITVDGHRIEQTKWTKIVEEFLIIAMDINREAVIGFRNIFASPEPILATDMNGEPRMIGDSGYYFNSHSDTAAKITFIIKPIAHLVGIKNIYCEFYN